MPEHVAATDSTGANSSPVERQCPSRRIQWPSSIRCFGMPLVCIACLAAAFPVVCKVFRTSAPEAASLATPRQRQDVVAGNLRCPDPLWNVGMIDTPGNVKLSHEFTLYNTSPTDQLEITEVRATCGCLVVNKPPPIDPLGSCALPVVLSAPAVPGEFRQQLTVVQKHAAPLQLMIVGGRIVPNRLVANPPSVNFGKLKRNSRAMQRLVLERSDGTALHIEKVVAIAPALQTTIERLSNERTAVTVDLDTSAAFSSGDVFRSTISIKPENGSEIDVSVMALADDRSSAFVGKIFVRRLPPGGSDESPLLVPHAAQEEDAISSVDFSGDPAITASHVIDDSGRPLVRLSRDVNDQGARFVHGTLSLQLAKRSVAIAVSIVCVK
jgi:hypothetical protein